MKRLVELAETDALTARAQVLIRTLGPSVESDERLRRVRRNLEQGSRARPFGWARVALGASLFAASAAAAVGGAAWYAAAPGPGEATSVVPSSLVSPRAPAPTARLAAAPPVPEPVTEAPVPSASARAVVARFTPPRLSDIARVHEAAKALRHDGDPERALQLLERSGGIGGPLAEEALALRIEASVARHDGRQAKLAAAYLAQYPSGRYRELAKRALAETSR